MSPSSAHASSATAYSASPDDIMQKKLAGQTQIAQRPASDWAPSASSSLNRSPSPAGNSQTNMERLAVKIPRGCRGGDCIQAVTDSGQKVHVLVPKVAGAVPGQTMIAMVDPMRGPHQPPIVGRI
eukprot:SAG31_NODE_18805_length_622_cov_0.808795_1_plen_124_part_10